MALETQVRESGHDRSVLLFLDQDPTAAASGTFSIVPFDLPPAGTEALVAPAGTPFFDTVPETVVERFPPRSRWLGSGGETLQIEFPHRIDRTPIRQLWSETDLRWPVRSISESRRSYRLER